MPSFSFWQKWLFVVGVAISVFGALLALLSGTPLFDSFNPQIDPAFWSPGTVGASARRFQQWVYGVWGATIAGWGVFVVFIARNAFAKKEKWAWNCMVAGLLMWFVLDTALSVYYEVYWNAAFNTSLLVLAGLPVVFTKKHFVG